MKQWKQSLRDLVGPAKRCVNIEEYRGVKSKTVGKGVETKLRFWVSFRGGSATGNLKKEILTVRVARPKVRKGPDGTDYWINGFSSR